MAAIKSPDTSRKWMCSLLMPALYLISERHKNKQERGTHSQSLEGHQSYTLILQHFQMIFKS